METRNKIRVLKALPLVLLSLSLLAGVCVPKGYSAPWGFQWYFYKN